MKKLFLLLLLSIASVAPAFAQGVIGFQNPVPPRSMYRQSKPILRTELPPSYSANRGSSPSSGMAAAVAVTGSIAATLRMIEETIATPKQPPVIVTPPSSNSRVVLPPELKKPDAPPVIVIPADTGVTSVHLVEMEPVVKHPVPITVIPMDIMSVP